MQHLANTLWSLAVVQHKASPEALDSFAEAFMCQMAQATPQHFGNAAWAMAKLGHDPLQGRFMNALIKQVGVRGSRRPEETLKATRCYVF